MARIALFGGSFDPPHFGHVMTVTAVLNSQLVDEVWLIPSGLQRDKTTRTSAEHRKAMISIMLATMFGSKVPVYLEGAQIDQDTKDSTTIDLVHHMKRQYAQHSFWIVIGSDLVPEVPNWHRAKELLKLTNFLVMPRPGYEPTDKLPARMRMLENPALALTNISSSMVRKLISRGESLEGIVPPAVIAHILRYGLYAASKLAKKEPKKAAKPVKAKIAKRTKKP